MPDAVGNAAANEGDGKLDVDAVIEHVRQLLFLPRPPPFPKEFERHGALCDYHRYVITIRQQLGDYVKGDFSREITLRGATAGLLKSLQANMRHLLWQMRQLEEGDFSQRIDYMGEFSESFNKMVTQLDDALTALRVKENELTALTRQLKIEVEKRGAALDALQKSEKNLKYLAEHDPLTGILNRRSFKTHAEMQIVRDTIMGSSSCLALMDVDHFKRINDTHGHLNGDLALKHIAKIGCSALRQDDMIGRYGGEEFIFLFPKTTAAQGRMAAERIRQLIVANPVELSGAAVRLTASFGVIAIPGNLVSRTGEDLLVRATALADAALYRAKENGRNQVEEAAFPAETETAVQSPFRKTSVNADQACPADPNSRIFCSTSASPSRMP